MGRKKGEGGRIEQRAGAGNSGRGRIVGKVMVKGGNGLWNWQSEKELPSPK